MTTATRHSEPSRSDGEESRRLPEGWYLTKVREVATVVNGYGFPERLQGRKDLPYPFIKVSDMNAEGAEIIVSMASNTVDDTILTELGARTYPPGTVIFPKVGGALLTNKKRILGVDATFDNNVMGIVPTGVDSQWLFYWIQTIDLAKFANTQALPSIRQSIIAALEIPLPPLSEQRRIAAILQDQLAAVERARAAAEAQLEAAKALPAAYLRAVFNSPEAQQWPRKYLGNYIASYRNGFGRRPKEKEDGPIVLRIADVSGGRVDLSNPRRGSMSESELETYRLNEGNVLFVRVNGSRDLVGRAVVVRGLKEVVSYNDHLIRVVLKENLYPEYLKLITDVPEVREYIVSKASTSAGQLTINQDGIASLELPIPPIDVQIQIAKSLNEQMAAAEQARTALQAQLDTINRLPAALLRRAFNGEL